LVTNNENTDLEPRAWAQQLPNAVVLRWEKFTATHRQQVGRSCFEMDHDPEILFQFTITVVDEMMVALNVDTEHGKREMRGMNIYCISTPRAPETSTLY
jgi:hypothetical protein